MTPGRNLHQQTSRLAFSDFSLTAVVAGVIAALVSYTGPFAVIIQATRAAGLDSAEAASWVWALAIGSGVSGVLLSTLTRMPIIVAWSTPGAALLIASIGGYEFSDAVGAFVFASAVACLLGVSGWFGKVLSLVPHQVLTALLAGVLLPFVLQLADAVAEAPLIGGTVLVTFLVASRFSDRYAVVLAFLAGVIVALLAGDAALSGASLQLTTPVFTVPTFDWSAILAIGVPLLLVTMASQNAPGLTLLRNEGYAPNDRLLVGGVSLVSTLFAPFGGHGINLAAITAAICTGKEAHADPARRYVAGIVCGLVNLAIGLFSAGLIQLFAGFSSSMVVAVAAVALLGALLTSLTSSFNAPANIAVPALLTMTVTASGVVFFGIGSAFWGLLLGVATWLLFTRTGRSAG